MSDKSNTYFFSVGYRVKSSQGILFRRWANTVLKEYLLRGYSVNSRLNQLEDRMDRRLAKHEADISELKERVDFFVQTQTPPLQGVFYDGQLWDAYGDGLIDELSKKLTAELGCGFTRVNLFNMRRFFLAFPIRHTLCDELSLSHVLRFSILNICGSFISRSQLATHCVTN